MLRDNTSCAAAELKELLSLLDSSDVSDPNFDGRLQDIMEVRLLQLLFCWQVLGGYKPMMLLTACQHPLWRGVCSSHYSLACSARLSYKMLC
jgi:hypothetical protein